MNTNAKATKKLVPINTITSAPALHGDLIPSDEAQRADLVDRISKEVEAQTAATLVFARDTIGRAINAGTWLVNLKMLCRDGRKAGKADMGKPLWTGYFAETAELRQPRIHLPLHRSTAHRLMVIARVIGKVSHEKQSRLPGDWNSLFELVQLKTAERIMELIDSGKVHPDLDRSEVRKLVDQVSDDGDDEDTDYDDRGDEVANFRPGSGAGQGRLDQLEPRLLTCPHCQEEFDARGQLDR